MNYRLCEFGDLTVGQSATFLKTITDADIASFVSITGDTNPLHVDAAFAARTFFRKPVAHGMLAGALFTHVVGMLMPGVGAIYRSQSLEFLKPVYVGDTLRVSLEIVSIDPENELIHMKGFVRNQDNHVVIEGSSTATLLRGYTD